MYLSFNAHMIVTIKLVTFYVHAYIRECVYKNVNISCRIPCRLQTVDIFARFHPRGCVCSTSCWRFSLYPRCKLRTAELQSDVVSNADALIHCRLQHMLDEWAACLPCAHDCTEREELCAIHCQAVEGDLATK